MKAITGIGIVVAVVGMLASAIMEGTSPAAFINIPALLLMTAGTSGAVMASTNFKAFMTLPKLAILAVKGAEHDARATITQMVRLAERARREGLLALEEDVSQIEDGFTRKGLQLVVDGTDSELVRGILQSELDGMQQRHHHNAALFAQAGGFAPTIGIIGTVMGLVHVLQNLSAPSTLGPAISGAFIATLYGVGSANLMFLPISNKLKELSAEELNHRYMLLEAVLSIQAGDNPRVLAEKLETYLSPAERGAEEQGEEAAEELKAAA
jgi:chemotaxis protein MotA